MAWPIILANAAEPLLGLADTAIIGNVGSAAELGAAGLGALILNFVFWTFGFLRMGTTGFTAQAVGAGDEAEVRATLGRALLMALAIGAALWLLQRPIGALALGALNGSPEVEERALRYFAIRIWGAPAALCSFAVMGSLIGIGASRRLLVAQLFLNGLNIALDVWFAAGLHWGLPGIALGTALAEWCTLLLALGLAYTSLRARHTDGAPFWPWQRIREPAKLVRTLGANLDLLLRTLCLLLGFGWFMNQSARLGDTVLAANHVLLQLLSFSAFFLDGFAFVAEAQVGAALGARSRSALRLAVLRSSELAGASALLLALAILALGDLAIRGLTDLDPVREAARSCAPLTALYVLVSFAAFQLDGIFIGATRTREMRNAQALSVSVFLAAAQVLTAFAGNPGLWAAFIAYVVVRALALGSYYPLVERAAGSGPLAAAARSR